jgi:cysteine desulfurase
MEIVSTAIEHPSVLETLHALTERGVTVREVAVDGDGRVQRDAFTQSLSEKTVLATVAYVNSEVGTVQDIRELSRVIRAFEKEHGTRVIFHTDASQAPLWLPVNLETLGVDLLTLDAGKCYGPKGVGILAKRHSTKLSAIHHGGGQESGLRSGTENVPLIIGCAEAFMRAQEKWRSRSAATAVLRDQLFFELERVLPNVIVNGSREHRVANNVNISLPGLDSEYAVIWLDAHGIAASTKSACGSQDASGSTVVRAMTGDEVRARSTLRLTLGEETTKDDIKQLVRTLAAHVAFMNKSLPPASNSQERHN